MGFFNDLLGSLTPATCSITDEDREWIDEFIYLVRERVRVGCDKELHDNHSHSSLLP